MWSVMQNEDPSVFVSDNNEGVGRVLRSRRGYAFFMESSSIDYVTHTKCNLTRIGSLLDSKSYGIGMPTSIDSPESFYNSVRQHIIQMPHFLSSDSPYRSHIDETVLKLKEDETIRKLKERWWKERNVGEEDCSIEDHGKDSELTMQNVGGIFLVLFAGCGVAIAIGIMEFLWNVKRVSIDEKVKCYLLHFNWQSAQYFKHLLRSHHTKPW